MSDKLIATVLVLVGMLVLAAPAGATRYATPDGSATGSECSQAAPCTLKRAVAVSTSGEEIVVAPGDHRVDSPAATGCTGAFAGVQPGGVGLDIQNRFVHGVADRPRPRIIGSARACTAVLVGAAGKLQNVEVHGANTSSPERYALLVDGAGTALNVVTGGATPAVQMRNGAHLYNSLIRARADGVGVLAYFGSNNNVPGSSSVLTNVTVLGRVLSASPQEHASKVDIQCVNSIATGGYRLEDHYPSNGSGQFITMSLNRCIGTLSSDGRPNEQFQSIAGTPPGTLRLAPDGFHQLAGSNSIDAGLTLSDPSFLFTPDIDGGPRTLNGTPDIGADEFGSARPLVDSGGVQTTSGTTAVVAGAINPGGVPTGAYVEFGPSAGYGSRTATATVAGGFAMAAVRFTLTGLTANAPYHYRLVGANGPVAGDDRVIRFPDGDRDGWFSNAECNDGNPGVHPGARDVPGNGVDEDCSGADQAPPPRVTPRIVSPITVAWALLGSRTRITRLLVRQLPRGALVQLRCSGKRCPFNRKRAARPRRGRVNALKALGNKRTLRAGQTLEVRVTKSGWIGKVARYKLRKDKQPKSSGAMCLPLGSSKPRRRC